MAIREKVYEFVKRWNSTKGTRYKTISDNSPSPLAISINRIFDDNDEALVDMYLDEEMNSTTTDIYLVSSYRFRKFVQAQEEKKKQEQEKKQLEESQKASVETASAMEMLGKELVKIMGNNLAVNITSKVKEEMDKYISDKVFVKVVDYNGKKNELKEITHKVFEDVLKFVAMDEPVFLTGPAGSGKNVICAQVAKAMGLEFYFSNAVTQEYKLTGYGDAMGNFVETQFYKWCKNGGVFMLDEMDASIPEALIVLNCAIANRYFDFPVIGRVELNENCRLVACGNTWGTGASMEYVGRNQLDGATLNRFATISVDYDPRIEESVAGGNMDIVKLCRDFRKNAEKNGCHIIVSYREISRLHKMIDIAKMDVVSALKSCLIKGLENDSLRMIMRDMDSSNKYYEAMKKIAEK